MFKNKEERLEYVKHVLRHEITHSFIFEIGLKEYELLKEVFKDDK